MYNLMRLEWTNSLHWLLARWVKFNSHSTQSSTKSIIVRFFEIHLKNYPWYFFKCTGCCSIAFKKSVFELQHNWTAILLSYSLKHWNLFQNALLLQKQFIYSFTNLNGRLVTMDSRYPAFSNSPRRNGSSPYTDQFQTCMLNFVWHSSLIWK